MRLTGFTYLGIAATTAFVAATAYENEGIGSYAIDISKNIEQVQSDASLSLVPTNELPVVLSGRVEVIDGRTLRYTVSGLSVELAGIDVCTEAQTATFEGTPWRCGVMATAWLISQTLGKTVECRRLDRWSNGVIVARCGVDGADVAGEAILAGYALVSDERRPGIPLNIYQELQQKARLARSGLWNSTFTEPADFRRSRFEDRSSKVRHIQGVTGAPAVVKFEEP